MYRPGYHFTPAPNWMSDPNGLVYYKGVYHLFFEHNAEAEVPGNMSWGHALHPTTVAYSFGDIALGLIALAADRLYRPL